MDRLKKFLLYIIIGLAFFAFSDLLINIGLNTTYKKIDGKNNIEQIDITRAEATLVNGRIFGKLNTPMTSELYKKYIKMDLYSENNVLLGTKYIEMKSLATNNNSFETYFKFQGVKRYEISLVDEKAKEKSGELFDIKLSQTEILLGVIVALLVI